jgi:hypothetical protein
MYREDLHVSKLVVLGIGIRVFKDDELKSELGLVNLLVASGKNNDSSSVHFS